MTGDRHRITRALVSVFDKQGLEELVSALAAAGVALVSTGSTAARIEAAGFAVTSVEELTGFPEALDGRVKTLHPRVHAGILADQRLSSHREQLSALGIEPFDLVVSNLYPFTETVSSGASPDECIEQIDIGGPSMVRGAAKNFASVAVITSPSQYGLVVHALASGGFTLDERRRLATEAFVHSATYDVQIATWMGKAAADTTDGTGFPAWLGSTWTRADVLRYGENPHQRAAMYVESSLTSPGLAQAEQLHGKQMSYNNYVDGDSARRTVYDFLAPTVAIVKHSNPCGIASGADIAEAHRKAHACDPLSAFGGVIASNRPVTVEMARQIAEVFTEVVIAPEFDDAAVAVLTAKKNVRLLRAAAASPGGLESKSLSGGLLLQATDLVDASGDDPATWSLVSGSPIDEAGLADLVFAWRACRAVKSNAVVLASAQATVGVGMGQVNRLDSARLAVSRAGGRATGAVAASDAFFPFADGLEVLADAGVGAVVQPGGSLRDEEVVAAAHRHGLTMYLTGTRHFFH